MVMATPWDANRWLRARKVQGDEAVISHLCCVCVLELAVCCGRLASGCRARVSPRSHLHRPRRLLQPLAMVISSRQHVIISEGLHISKELQLSTLYGFASSCQLCVTCSTDSVQEHSSSTCAAAVPPAEEPTAMPHAATASLRSKVLACHWQHAVIQGSSSNCCTCPLVGTLLLLYHRLKKCFPATVLMTSSVDPATAPAHSLGGLLLDGLRSDASQGRQLAQHCRQEG
jgi:hypothetical protein